MQLSHGGDAGEEVWCRTIDQPRKPRHGDKLVLAKQKYFIFVAIRGWIECYYIQKAYKLHLWISRAAWQRIFTV
jgi:hypothetical protein